MLAPVLGTLARFNRWANGRLYDTAETLSDEEYRADRGAFFGSAHRTLNHILVGDLLWMRRLTGTGDQPKSLDAVLFDDLATLKAARNREDLRIIAYVDGLDEAATEKPCTFQNVAGETFTFPTGPLVLNMFNHATHHRGQAHAILTGFGRKVPPLDQFIFFREAGLKP